MVATAVVKERMEEGTMVVVMAVTVIILTVYILLFLGMSTLLMATRFHNRLWS